MSKYISAALAPLCKRYGEVPFRKDYYSTVNITASGEGYLSYTPIVVPPFEHPDYPHKCPRCQAPAYIGLTNVDCIANCS